jgi:hypothetical protein
MSNSANTTWAGSPYYQSKVGGESLRRGQISSDSCRLLSIPCNKRENRLPACAGTGWMPVLRSYGEDVSPNNLKIIFFSATI